MAPYQAETSASPQERKQTPSPEPYLPGIAPALRKAHASGSGRGGYNNDAGPSKRAKLTQSDLQRMQLEKLLANPEREVALPEPVREKTLRDPHEMMKNVQGSAAGAGSGEFHVYKASRRREFERLKLMEDKGRALEEQEAFQARQDERDAIADAKTARNRAKRQKRKGGKKGEGEKAPAAGDAAKAGTKRKLAGGAEGFTAPRAGAEESEDEGGDEGAAAGGTGAVGVGNLNIPIPTEGGALPGSQANGELAPRRVIEEPTVVIHDDD